MKMPMLSCREKRPSRSLTSAFGAFFIWLFMYRTFREAFCVLWAQNTVFLFFENQRKIITHALPYISSMSFMSSSCAQWRGFTCYDTEQSFFSPILATFPEAAEQTCRAMLLSQFYWVFRTIEELLETHKARLPVLHRLLRTLRRSPVSVARAIDSCHVKLLRTYLRARPKRPK